MLQAKIFYQLQSNVFWCKYTPALSNLGYVQFVANNWYRLPTAVNIAHV